MDPRIQQESPKDDATSPPERRSESERRSQTSSVGRCNNRAMAVEAPAGRLAELTIASSLASDLGSGQPLEHGLRTCWLSLAVADALGLAASARSCVYYVALLRFLGCILDASETAMMAGGDDLGFNEVMGPMFTAQRGEGTRYFVRRLGADLRLHRRVGLVARALSDPGAEHRSLSGHCEVGARFAGQLGLPDAVRHALAHAYERWDGKGHPDGLAGDEVPLAVRIVAAARDVELWSRLSGWPAAAEVLRRRRGHGYDPAVADALLDDGARALAAIPDDVRAGVLDAEPSPVLAIADREIDRALEAVAYFADLKSVFFRGHSTGVARLVSAAAGIAGLSREEVTRLGRAALVHDVGRVGVPSGIWDRPGTLVATDWERVRMHSYLGERVLEGCSLLEPFAAIAGRHHERLDGTGYHRGVAGDQLAVSARLLAVADAYHAMTEERPHRQALTQPQATAALRDEVDAGRFGEADVRAVLDAAGQSPRPARVARPAGLTEREVDVLRLIARGHSNKEVARQLGISPKTVGHHVEHIYAKAAVTTRVGATLFAMEHGLLAS